MAKTGAKRHTHKYHQIDGVWHCAKSDCTHFMPGNVAGNMPGKISVCWNCGNDFALDARSLGMDKPVCFECDPERQELSTLAEILSSKGL